MPIHDLHLSEYALIHAHLRVYTILICLYTHVSPFTHVYTCWYTIRTCLYMIYTYTLYYIRLAHVYTHTFVHNVLFKRVDEWFPDVYALLSLAYWHVALVYTWLPLAYTRCTHDYVRFTRLRILIHCLHMFIYSLHVFIRSLCISIYDLIRYTLFTKVPYNLINFRGHSVCTRSTIFIYTIQST